MADLLIPQSTKYVSTGSVPGGSEAAYNSHDEGKPNRAGDHDRRHLQTEYHLAEGNLILSSGGHAVERQHQEDAEGRAQQGQQQRLQHE